MRPGGAMHIVNMSFGHMVGWAGTTEGLFPAVVSGELETHIHHLMGITKVLKILDFRF